MDSVTAARLERRRILPSRTDFDRDKPGRRIAGAVEIRRAVPGLDDATFQKIAQSAKENCPLSKALAAVNEMTLDAALED